MSSAISPFQVSVPDAELADLHERLARTRWPDAETVDDWTQGVPLHYLQDLCTHWRTQYDWRATEERLNAIPQFRTDIDGLDVHFLHARSSRPGALPLLVTHGWPGSVLELLDLIPLLVDPPPDQQAFHLVCPSLPGFGFSARPTEPGWTVERMAAAWSVLMDRLGYHQYAAHGTDWGSFITAAMAEQDRGAMLGIHVTMPFARPPEQQVHLSERDRAGLEAMTAFQENESGYSAIQATRPQTLGYGLTDSAAGQLAWVAEKYWAWSDHDGDLDRAIARDRVLDMASTTWFTRTAASSARIYWESHNKLALGPVSVPTAVSNFPRDGRMPRPWVEGRFSDLRSWIDHPRGGHFPALEQPDVLAEHLRSFVTGLRSARPSGTGVPTGGT